MTDISKFLGWYESSVWIRALVQLAPGGGSVDVVLAGKASAINQRRFEELLLNVSEQLKELGKDKLDEKFLATDEFFELFRTAVEIAAHSASIEKRKLVAAYLSGTIDHAVITDLGTQVLEDLRFMHPLHLQVIASLPVEANQSVSKGRPPASLSGMSSGIYEKAMSDLERFGFIRYNTVGIGALGGGGGHWETTEYVRVFREHVKY